MSHSILRPFYRSIPYVTCRKRFTNVVRTALLIGYLLAHREDVRGQRITTVFAPDSIRKTVEALPIDQLLTIDGLLNEPSWNGAKPISDFFQVNPNQGEPLYTRTEVRLLTNKQYLYIGVINYDTLGRRALRAPNFKRDFEVDGHDVFGVVIDGFNDSRTAMGFLTNPYGAQRDLLSVDDLVQDVDWDGLWRVRTTRQSYGWIAEMAIPWQSLRYKPINDGEQSWGINFFRNRRITNEQSVWSPYPRSFSPYRMSYAGRLAGIKPPPPSPNIRLQPYLLATRDVVKPNSSPSIADQALKIGGEIKWAINPNSVLDVTVNTDFAQADVDRQVNNLSRFSVMLPERRPFFLENASLFSPGLVPVGGLSGAITGGSMTIRPFFSRTIGLLTLSDGTSRPVPISVGARYVYRSSTRNIGGLMMRQQSTDVSPLTDYGVFRYTQNIGKQNRIGALATLKNRYSQPGVEGYQHGVVALDGFFRFSPTFSYQTMVSTSFGNRNGVSGYHQFFYRSNQGVAWLTQSIVTKDFVPEMGFVSRTDVMATTPGFYLANRGRWLPSFIREFNPGLYIELYHKLSTKRLQEMQVVVNPIWVTTQKGGGFGFFVKPIVQRLDEEDKRPLGINLATGVYQYVRYSLAVLTDPSQKISGQLIAETGPYYDGQLNYVQGSLRISPVPHLAIKADLEINQFKHVGIDQYAGTVKLVGLESRMAINPRLQLISFFQRNTYNESNAWNIRLSWEYKPLSFLYLIYNQGDYSQVLTGAQKEQHLVGKLSYLKQF